MSEQPAKPETVQLPTETWVFVEHCITADAKAGVVFRTLESKTSTDLGATRVFGAKKFRNVRPGAVYTIQCDDKTCYPNSLRYVGEFADREQATAWEANDATRRLEDQRKKLLSEVKKKSQLSEVLAPLRKIYQRCPNRTAMELLILRYLHSGELP